MILFVLILILLEVTQIGKEATRKILEISS